jgi:hypothetical protein
MSTGTLLILLSMIGLVGGASSFLLFKFLGDKYKKMNSFIMQSNPSCYFINTDAPIEIVKFHRFSHSS